MKKFNKSTQHRQLTQATQQPSSRWVVSFDAARVEKSVRKMLWPS